MVLLTTVANPVTARILAAHLGAEGVVWQLRGNVDGPYPVGPVELWVDEGDVDLARLLVAGEHDDGDARGDAATDVGPEAGPDVGEAPGTPPGGDDGGPGRYRDRPWLVGAAVVLVALFLLGRLLVLLF